MPCLRCADLGHIQRQYDRKPVRCQRITVSGRMMASAPQVFGNHPQTPRRTNLSPAENGNRPTLPRRSTMICCRSTRTSASSAVRDRNRSRTRLKISLMRSAIRPSVARFCAPRQPDSIYDSDSSQHRPHLMLADTGFDCSCGFLFAIVRMQHIGSQRARRRLPFPPRDN